MGFTFGLITFAHFMAVLISALHHIKSREKKKIVENEKFFISFKENAQKLYISILYFQMNN